MIAASNLQRAAHRRSLGRCRVVLCLAAFVALLAAAPGVSAAASRCEARAIRGHEALLAGTLANWEPVDDQTVLIWTRHTTRAYLVKLAMPVEGLTEADVITLVDGDNDRTITACGYDGLELGSADGETSSAVGIVSIELLSEKRTAELDPGAHPLARVSARI